jgi:hypothetical protein
VRKVRTAGRSSEAQKGRVSEVCVPERSPLDNGCEAPGRVQAQVGDLIYNGTLRIVRIDSMELVNKEGRAFGYRIISVEAV